MLVETLTSSVILFLVVVASINSLVSSLDIFSRSKEIDRRMTEVHSINENVRQEVFKWRWSSDKMAEDQYTIEESDCGDNMAQLLLNERKIVTSAVLVAQGHSVIVRNDGFPDATIYLPQSAWCL
jgi:Na+-translocating ferredoxin:NAD+ oxidoreductase RnfG subunit